ncbi:UNVERIFIED_CONTAM: hypothetical protein Sradi_2026300 [Sesamum radiatum]|uniref:CCHC-type domain-containing protein n=1 Tax=Sesamum radiatum TaxID=300843 RepID=A0AAW2TFW8_SESRA
MAGYVMQLFDGKSDFSIWQQKMKGILIQQKVFKAIDDNIDDFTKLIQDIKLNGDKNIDDYTPIVLLNAIPETYSDVKAAIKYGRDNVSLDTVINGLKSKEIDLKTSSPSQDQQEVNFVRGRAKNKYGKHRNRSRSESSDTDEKQKDRRCYNCGKKGHYIKNYRKPKSENKEGDNKDSDQFYGEVY